jgi:precorrin-2 dehydrogenase/sirohydrochlorin ferrochelatase
MIEPYPLSLLLNNRAVAVIGGGGIAERKVLSLLDTGAKITVIAPKATKKIKSLAAKKKVVLKLRNFVHDDLKGKLLIFAATNSDEVNKQVSRLARKKGILVNCVDDPKECDFFVPSFFRRGSLLLAVSTGGKIPALAKKIRRDIELSYGALFAEYVKLLAKARGAIYRKAPLSFQKKRDLIEKMIESNILSLLKKGKKKKVSKIIQEFLQKNL